MADLPGRRRQLTHGWPTCGADLGGADLTGSWFDHADLRGADLNAGRPETWTRTAHAGSRLSGVIVAAGLPPRASAGSEARWRPSGRRRRRCQVSAPMCGLPMRSRSPPWRSRCRSRSA
ncbi:pentapeptide repeat-containing protein [Streptomyces sp. NPDC002467]|uniref:pentapeptide repeat-containing protein n=1 Tax=Streptomyces sp. NPDC002467 TaxID=3364647 RepID=UPI0036CD5ED1